MDQTLFAAIVERQQDAVFTIEMNPEQPLRPRFIYANRAFHALTGFTPDDIAGTGYPVLLGAETDRKLVASCAGRVAAGEAVACEVRLYRKDGSAFWAEVRSYPLDGASGRCVLMLRDVSEQRAANERVRLLSLAVERASDFVVITDATPPSAGGPFIVFANESYLEASGYTLAELIGRPSLVVVADANDARMVASLYRNVELGIINEREVLLTRKDGSSFWCEIVAKPFEDVYEGRSYRILIARDITARKRASNQVSLLLSAIESSPDPTVLYEPDDTGTLTVSYENESAVRLGRHRLLDILEADREAEHSPNAALARGERVTRFVLDEYAQPGDSQILEFTASAILNAAGSIEGVITVERRIADTVGRPPAKPDVPDR
jgi:PAS domain S-box-containing protein